MKHILITSLVLIISFLTNFVNAQNIGINADGSTPNPNAMLDIKASNKGLLIPRTSTTSRIAIPNTKGLLVYDTTLASFWYNDGTAWQQIANGAALNGTLNYLPKFTGTTTIGNSQIVDNGQYVGIGTTSPTAGLNIIHNGGIIAKGDTLSTNSYSLTETGTGSKFIWYPKKGAVRGGFIDVLNDFVWDDNYIGNWSTAFGYNPLANGKGSFALGYGPKAQGDYSFALGLYSTSNGKYSFSVGNNAYAAGLASVAMGNSPTAAGNYSFAEGYNCEAVGIGAVAIGYSNTAPGNFSFSAGSLSHANGDNAVALGDNTTAGGSASFSVGDFTNAAGNYSFAGGISATASGSNSIAMGSNITASGNGSMIFGSNLFDGGHKGNAMFGDTDPWGAGSVGSGTDDQMICRFSNGYYFLTGGNTYRTGMVANHGDNSWSQISDSTKKEKLIPVNGEELLNKISKFKLTTWNYKGQDSKTFRHYGPMAQDFHNAFGHDALGTIGNDTLINQADFLGVSFNAIQALEKRTEKIEQEQLQIEDLKKENASLADNNQKMQDQIKALLSSYAVLNKKVETLASVGNKINSIAKK